MCICLLLIPNAVYLFIFFGMRRIEICIHYVSYCLLASVASKRCQFSVVKHLTYYSRSNSSLLLLFTNYLLDLFSEQINGKEHIIDSCEGDSGGPFVVRHPTKENKFIQTGIPQFIFVCLLWFNDTSKQIWPCHVLAKIKGVELFLLFNVFL